MAVNSNIMVRFLRKIGDDSYRSFGEPCTYAEALKTLSQIPEESLALLDLESVATGRLVSWVLPEKTAVEVAGDGEQD